MSQESKLAEARPRERWPHGCDARRVYLMRMAGLGRALPLCVPSIFGQSVGSASNCVPDSWQMIVSSLFVPVMDGFHANAWPDRIGVLSPGAAIASRGW